MFLVHELESWRHLGSIGPHGGPVTLILSVPVLGEGDELWKPIFSAAVPHSSEGFTADTTKVPSSLVLPYSSVPNIGVIALAKSEGV